MLPRQRQVMRKKNSRLPDAQKKEEEDVLYYFTCPCRRTSLFNQVCQTQVCEMQGGDHSLVNLHPTNFSFLPRCATPSCRNVSVNHFHRSCLLFGGGGTTRESQKNSEHFQTDKGFVKLQLSGHFPPEKRLQPHKDALPRNKPVSVDNPTGISLATTTCSFLIASLSYLTEIEVSSCLPLAVGGVVSGEEAMHPRFPTAEKAARNDCLLFTSWVF